MTGLFTIGYEGASLEDFVATLQLMRIDVLLDVRELPISRRRGFAKTALAETLSVAGIQYQHERSLGSPKPIRDQLKRDRDYNTFFANYQKHLDNQGAVLESLASNLSERIVLLCYERDHRQCHRSAVARALQARTGVKPVHLGVQNHEQRTAYAAARLGPGQSLPATE